MLPEYICIKAKENRTYSVRGEDDVGETEGRACDADDRALHERDQRLGVRDVRLDEVTTVQYPFITITVTHSYNLSSRGGRGSLDVATI